MAKSLVAAGGSVMARSGVMTLIVQCRGENIGKSAQWR